MYEPNKKNFDLHNIKKKNYDKYDITRSIEIECDSIDNLLSEIDIKILDLEAMMLCQLLVTLIGLPCYLVLV